MDNDPSDSDDDDDLGIRDEFEGVEVDREWEDFQDKARSDDLQRIIDNAILILSLDITKALLPKSGYPQNMRDAIAARIEFLIEKHKG